MSLLISAVVDRVVEHKDDDVNGDVDVDIDTMLMARLTNDWSTADCGCIEAAHNDHPCDKYSCADQIKLMIFIFYNPT